MDRAGDQFGRLLLSRTTLSKRRFVWAVWAGVGILLLGATYVCALELETPWSCRVVLTQPGLAPWVVAAMYVPSADIGLRRLQPGPCTLDFLTHRVWEA